MTDRYLVDQGYTFKVVADLWKIARDTPGSCLKDHAYVLAPRGRLRRGGYTRRGREAIDFPCLTRHTQTHTNTHTHARARARAHKHTNTHLVCLCPVFPPNAPTHSSLARQARAHAAARRDRGRGGPRPRADGGGGGEGDARQEQGRLEPRAAREGQLQRLARLRRARREPRRRLDGPALRRGRRAALPRGSHTSRHITIAITITITITITIAITITPRHITSNLAHITSRVDDALPFKDLFRISFASRCDV